MLHNSSHTIVRFLAKYHIWSLGTLGYEYEYEYIYFS